MFNFFRRKKPKIVVPLESGPFNAVWGKRRQPSPGMMAYAYETLGLAPTSPINGAVHVRSHINQTQPEQTFLTQAVPVQGIALAAGQIYGQPLYDPDAGYTDPMTGLNNVPYSKPAPGNPGPTGVGI